MKMQVAIGWLVLLISLSGCKGEKDVSELPAESTTPAAAAGTGTGTDPSPSAPRLPEPVTLAAGAPIPGTAVALWLIADDAKAGEKLEIWRNAAVGEVVARADEPAQQPTVVANAIGGHAAVRFDGENNMLFTNIDISPARMPEATVFVVFNSSTEATDPLRKLYGNDNGSYDRAVGLDSRSTEKNYTVFTGGGVEGYFALKTNETYVTADQYTATDFSGWVNGAPMLTKVPATWTDALPNLYLGGTGTVYHEPWQGDIAEVIVYARVLTEAERFQVEAYLGTKYGVPIVR